MVWPLTWVIIIGTLPGVFIGYCFRTLIKLMMGIMIVTLALQYIVISFNSSRSRIVMQEGSRSPDKTRCESQ